MLNYLCGGELDLFRRVEAADREADGALRLFGRKPMDVSTLDGVT
jgi:hypothetical protein